MKNKNYNIANEIALYCEIYPNDQELGKRIRVHYGKKKKTKNKS